MAGDMKNNLRGGAKSKLHNTQNVFNFVLFISDASWVSITEGCYRLRTTKATIEK